MMFPWNYGFAWDKGHIIFLGVFYTVVLVVLTTLLLAAWRTLRDFRRNRASSIVWHENFEDLSRAERTCRHAFTGEMRGRVCELGFNCGQCKKHGQFVSALQVHGAAPELMQGVIDDTLGVPLPLDRYYHRGHTWLKPEAGGTYMIGLDELARRIAANPDSVELPPVGTKLTAQGAAWTLHVHGAEVHVMSPVEGEVIETARGEKGWFLRIKPTQNTSFCHLLRGFEVVRWMTCEMERVQLMVSESAAIPTLADGGVPVDDFAAACPQADWRSIRGALFLTN
jgi:glycine cleavage system H lipoate-binding protein